jgi:hypothetical protein
MTSWLPPTTSAPFKAQFVRDFNYAPDTDANNLAYVTDADILAAYNNALQNFNPGLFGTLTPVDQITPVFLWLSAFYLVWSIQNSTAGLSSQSKFPINNKSVGGIALGFAIPEQYLKNPVLSQYAQNGYGMMYLSFALPKTIGNVQIAFGTVGTTDGF